MNKFDELNKKINQLNDSDLMEASIYYFSDVFDISSRTDLENKLSHLCGEEQGDFYKLMSIENQIEKERDSYRKLLRFLLLENASSNESEYEKVQDAVNAVGQKQVITEIGLAVILGTLAVMYLISYTEGKTKEKKESSYEIKPDGTVIFKVKQETTYVDAGSALANLFDFFKNMPGKK